MQGTQSKATTSFLLALITSIKVAKIKTSFLGVWYSCSNNDLYCYNYSTKLDLIHMLFCLNNSDFDY